MPKLSSIRSVPDAHEDGIWAAAWLSSSAGDGHSGGGGQTGAVLLTGSVDETVKVWAGDDLTAVKTISGHTLGE